MHTVRVFNSVGVEAFRKYLHELVSDPTLSPPLDLLSDGSKSEPLATNVEVDSSREFANKWELGDYLAQTLETLMSDGRLDRDIGLWSWLGLCFFDVTCPPSKSGNRKPGNDARHILTRDYGAYYRHLLRGPWQACRIHGGNARAMLASAPFRLGEASEQLLSRQHLVENIGFFSAVNRLYLKELQGSWDCVAGAAGKGGGTFRRLGKILKQYDRTYDLTVMNGDQIYGLLPREFDRFKR